MHIIKVFLPGIEETRGTAAPAFNFCGICGVSLFLYFRKNSLVTKKFLRLHWRHDLELSEERFSKAWATNDVDWKPCIVYALPGVNCDSSCKFILSQSKWSGIQKTKTSDFIRKGLISWEYFLYPMQNYFLTWHVGRESCRLGVKITKENRCTVAYRRNQQSEQGKILGKIHWLGSYHIW